MGRAPAQQYRIKRLRTAQARLNKFNKKRTAAKSTPSSSSSGTSSTSPRRIRNVGIQCIPCNICGGIGHTNLICHQILHPDIRPLCLDCNQCVFSFKMLPTSDGMTVKIIFCSAHTPKNKHPTPPRYIIHNATSLSAPADRENLAAHGNRRDNIAIQIPSSSTQNNSVSAETRPWVEDYNTVKMLVLSQNIKFEDALDQSNIPRRTFERRRSPVELHLISPVDYKKIEEKSLKPNGKLNVKQLTVKCCTALGRSDLVSKRQRALSDGLLF